MKKEEIIRKLTSRKLWIAVAGFVSMLMISLGASEGSAAQITALIMSGATVIGYILGEGLVDSSRKQETEDEDIFPETSYIGNDYESYDSDEEVE